MTLHENIITAIRRTKRTAERCSIYVDDVFLAACSIDIAQALGLKKGMICTPELLAQLRSEDRRLSLRQKAYGYATYKPRTRKQVIDHYRALEYAPEEIDAVVAWLEEFRLVNDAEFAARFILASKQQRPMSARAIRQKLTQKGVPADVIEQALATEVTPDAELQAALHVAEKKLRMMRRDVTDSERNDKIVRFLQYRGYTWPTIKHVLAALPSLTATLCIVILALSAPVSGDAQPSAPCVKNRLPETVNRYQPTTVPVVTWDGTTLYVDRKLHPGNAEGSNDPDDVWVSRKGANGNWMEARREEFGTVRRPDVLFSMSSDGLRALVHGPFIVRGADTVRCFAVASRLDPDSVFTTITPVILPSTPRSSRNFYGHMSDDGTIIVLAVERSDALGDLDLYVTRRCGTSWTEPLNLGPLVNTAGFEGAPHLAPDGRTLYYASNGMDDRRGKTDLYVTRRLDDSWTNWSTPLNLGSCINSAEEEKAFYLLPGGREAFIVSWDAESERQGLYRVTLPAFARPEPYCVFTGVVQDAYDKHRIHPARIIVRDTAETDSCYHPRIPTAVDGSFSVVLPQHRRYVIRAVADGYIAAEQTLGIRSLDSISPLHLSITLFDTRRPLASLYFERGSSVLSDSSMDVLRGLAEAYGLRAVNFDVAGYADVVGSVPFNKALSEQRAEAVKAALSKLNIDPARVTARGKGIEVIGLSMGMQENPLSRRVDIFPTERGILQSVK